MANETQNVDCLEIIQLSKPANNGTAEPLPNGHLVEGFKQDLKVDCPPKKWPL